MSHSQLRPHEYLAATPPVVPAHTTVTAEEFRGMMRCFPTGVSVVTTIDEHGRPRGMTCTSLTSVTLSPPTVLVCLNRQSGTSRAVHHHSAFAVNLLHERAGETARLFAGDHPDRFGRLSWHHSRILNVPLLGEDAFTVAVCSVRDSTPMGDHDVIFGRVHAIEEHDDSPLLHGMREFRSWPASPPE
ncbi:flavin reductase family protein [Actinopolyspora mortivallis]|uniref:Oxidase n=1 Tax=Actinopolyspora mortivallis TaxID=33906 RepID=A0A2T0GYR7_ACTMO|nr:flavin reductase family protein [Actinopolyspora mortivallis]PRW64258.1 oxidase [Actinopolyspora mortivallis]